MFIDSWVTVVFDEKGLEGFKIRWVFDEMFSSMMIMDFDTSQNGRFEAFPWDVRNFLSAVASLHSGAKHLFGSGIRKP